MDGYNADITDEQRQKLREIFPEIFTEDKIDFDRLRATLGDTIELGERYGLNWKGKSNVFAKIQEKTVSTIHPQLDESVDWDTTQNMFIEGDNLEALKVLHKAYYGKIKMIYIDPPYNTLNDFIYDDNKAKSKRESERDESWRDEDNNILEHTIRNDGLRINNGAHKHSDWLDMMYPRLFLARNLLCQDGVIFVSIDDNEVHNLRLMMNEIFGEENFVAQLIWKKKQGGGNDSTNFIIEHEYVLCYSKNVLNLKLNLDDEHTLDDNLYPFKDKDGEYGLVTLDKSSIRFSESLVFDITGPDGKIYRPRIVKGRQSCWRWGKSKVRDSYDQLVFKNNKVYTKYYRPKGVQPKSLLTDPRFGRTETGKEELRRLFPDEGDFTYPKPVNLVKHLVRISTSNDDIILDLFCGSGTTAQAVYELNLNDDSARKWIMVQLPELTDERSGAYKAGYKTISNISRERIRRAGTKIGKESADRIAERQTPLDLAFRSYILGNSNFKKWNELVTSPNEIRQQALDSINPIEDGVGNDDLLAEVLLKRGISPLVEIKKYDDFVFVSSETLAISLSHKMTEELFVAILAKSPSQIILLDQAFRDDVNLKTNLILQAEKQGIVVDVV